MEEAVWFWINPSSGTTLSPEFSTQEEAQEWFDRMIAVHNETFSLIERIRKGKFYTVSGRVNLEKFILGKKLNPSPFSIKLHRDILSVEVLAVSEEDARARVEEYFDILEWSDEPEE
jgi:hypothetical protein